MRILSVEAALFPELTTEAKGPPRRGVPYLGTKVKLLDWIQGQIPDGTKRVVDPFSGGGSVSYMLKRAGYEVASNDSLRWALHVARATVVNQRSTVTEDEIKALIQSNPKAGEFVRKHYSGKFWKPGVHKVIDEVRENIDALKGFKRDIALAALGATMLSARGWFQLFTATKVADGGYSPELFKARFARVVRRLNEMVFEGPACTAHSLDARAFLPKVQADVAYFDPPYVTEASAHNYSADYHVIEAVMVKGVGRTPSDSVTKTEKTQADLTRASVAGFFGEVLQAAGHIDDWLLSYRDKSFPREDEIKKLFTDAGRTVRQVSKDHTYTLAGTRRDEAPSHAKEVLFIGTAAGKAQKKAAAKEESMKTPVIKLAAPDVKMEGFWEKHAKAIVEAFGWKGLAIACAIVDVGYPAREHEGKLPMAFDAYHHPLMVPHGDAELHVVRDAVIKAQTELADNTKTTTLTVADRKSALAKVKKLDKWIAQDDEAKKQVAAPPEEGAPAVDPPAVPDELGKPVEGGDPPKDPPNDPPKDVVPPPKGSKGGLELDELLVMSGQAGLMVAHLEAGSMVAVAATGKKGEDHAIKFILCHAGTNKNGDHFTVDELKKVAATAAGVKINLKHGQKAQDIVGKTETAAFEDKDGGRVVCAGKLFTGEDELAAKARRLIHEKLITKVSMECSYGEGECSICGHKHASHADRCDHLKNHKGQKLEGKDVFEILHGVVFTGAGLLEGYEPADPNADITAMAFERDGRMHVSAYGGEVDGPARPRPETMKQVLVRQEIREDIWKTNDALHQVVGALVDSFAAEKNTLDETVTKIRKAATDYAERLAQILKSINKETGKMEDPKATKALSEMSHEELLQHAETLAGVNTQLTDKVAASDKETALAKATEAAKKLVALMEKKGRVFEKDEARAAEVTKLAALTEEARQAVEDTWTAMPDAKAAAAAEAGEASGEGTQAAAAAGKGALRANAGKEPGASGDPEPKSLGEKLKAVAMAVYHDRVKSEGGEVAAD